MTTAAEIFASSAALVLERDVETVNHFADDALDDSQLLAVRFDAVRGVAALVLDLRLALNAFRGNVGLLVATEVSTIDWGRQPGLLGLRAWTVAGSRLRSTSEGWAVKLDFWPAPGATLAIVANGVQFIEGAASLSAMPDYVNEHASAEVHAERVWSADFQPLAITRSA